MVFPRLFTFILFALFLLLLGATSSSQSQDLSSSSLLLPYRGKRDQPFETRERVRATFEMIKDSLSALKDTSEAKQWAQSATDGLKKLAKFASVAPGCVGAIFSVINMALAFIPQHDPVLAEVTKGFAEVNRKLDSLSFRMSNLATDVEWFNYASIYSQDELRILNAWMKLTEFRENFQLAQNREDKIRLAVIFTNYYEYTGTEASVANFYHYLTVDSTSLSGNLNDLLKKKFKCDINKINIYNYYFSSLLLKGVVLNEVYWKLIGLNPSNTEAGHTQMFNNVYRAQSSVVNFCLNNYKQYMVRDVEEIGKALSPDNKQAIAVQVKETLDKKYNWYNWVVLVYNTDDEANYLLRNMTKVPLGTVTVAVDYTLKVKEEDQIRKPLVIRAAKSCFDEQYCESINTDRRQCTDVWRDHTAEHVDTNIVETSFSDYAKATHVVYGNDFVELPEPFYRHGCTWGRSTSQISIHYTRHLSVCTSVRCQHNGQCRTLLDSNEWLCECQDGYYGDTCEKKMDPSLASTISIDYPVLSITSTYGRLKKMESRLEEIFNSIQSRCHG